MKENSSVTAAQIADFFDVSVENINSKIRALKKKGLIKRAGSTKSGTWEVVENKK